MQIRYGYRTVENPESAMRVAGDRSPHFVHLEEMALVVAAVRMARLNWDWCLIAKRLGENPRTGKPFSIATVQTMVRRFGSPLGPRAVDREVSLAAHVRRVEARASTLEKTRAWRKANHLRSRYYGRRYEAKCQPLREFHESDKKRLGIQRRGWHTVQTEKDRMALLERLGGRCLYCGEYDPLVLQIDHRYGDGASDRLRGKGKGRYRRLLALSDGELDKLALQVLCANCHLKKTRLYGEFAPTQERRLTAKQRQRLEGAFWQDEVEEGL